MPPPPSRLVVSFTCCGLCLLAVWIARVLSSAPYSTVQTWQQCAHADSWEAAMHLSRLENSSLLHCQLCMISKWEAAHF